MFEVMRPELTQFSPKTIIPRDLLDGCPSKYFQYNDNRHKGMMQAQDLDEQTLMSLCAH